MQDPGFFEMVEYFFHKACILSEDRLIDVDMKAVRATREEKSKKAHGIQDLKQTLHVNLCKQEF